MVSSMRFTKVCVTLVLMAILLLVAALPVSAAEIRVDDNCTLRNAIKSANEDKSRGDCEAGDGDDVILLKRDSKPGQGQLEVIRSTIFIEGLGNKLEVDNAHSVFKIQGGDLTVLNLDVVYFDNTRERKSFEVYDGSLTLINVTVKNCEVGILQRDSHTSLRGNTNICGLPEDQLVIGEGTSDFSLPPPVVPQTCGNVPAGVATVSATYGQASGVQCQVLDGGGIGIQSIIDAGFISAINVWGYVEQGVEICFPQLGSLIFLDSAITPRTVSAIAAYRKGNSTCARLTRPGSLVLMPGEAPTASAPVVAEPAGSQPAESQPAPAQPAAVEGCPIHTTGHLRLRGAPSLQGEILGFVPRGSNLNSPSRTTYWYQVNYQGLTGWIGHKFVSASC